MLHGGGTPVLIDFGWPPRGRLVARNLHRVLDAAESEIPINPLCSKDIWRRGRIRTHGAANRATAFEFVCNSVQKIL